MLSPQRRGAGLQPVLRGNPVGKAWVGTHETFGCNHHERKPEVKDGSE